MNVTSALEQATVLHDIVADFITYLETIDNSIVGNVVANDILHDGSTYYGVSASVIDDITQAKDLIVNAKQRCIGTLD